MKSNKKDMKGYRNYPFSQLLQWANSEFLNPHNLEILVCEQSILDSIFTQPQINETVEVIETETEMAPFLVPWRVVSEIFDIGRNVMARNDVPGVTWKGPICGKATGAAHVLVDLNNEQLRSRGLERKHFQHNCK